MFSRTRIHTSAIAVWTLLGVLHPAAQPSVALQALLADVQRRYERYLANGLQAEEKKQLLALLSESDDTWKDNPAYLLAKSDYLAWLEEHDASSAAFAAVPDEFLSQRNHVFNRLSRRLQDPDAALELFRRLARIDSSRAQDWLHKSFAQRFAPELRDYARSPAARQLVDGFSDPDYPDVTRFTAGFRLWVAVNQNGVTPEQLAVLSRGDFGDEDSLASRYRLLVATGLDHHNNLQDQAEALRWRVIAENVGRLLQDASKEPTTQWRGMRRYWIAYAYSALAERAAAQSNEAAAVELMREAAHWSPDRIDRRHGNAAFFERLTLGGEAEYQSAYARLLERVHRADEALDVQASLPVIDPSSVEALRARFAAVRPHEDFDTWWAMRAFEGLPSAPDFILPTPDGREVKFSDYRGRWLLLDFWGTWCGPCHEEMPVIDRLAREVDQQDPRRGAVLTLASNDTADSVRLYMASRGYKYPVVLADEAAMEAFEVPGVPYKVLVSPDGRLREFGIGTQWETEARRALLAPK